MHYDNDRSVCGREKEKYVKDKNHIDQLATECSNVVKHQKIIGSIQMRRNFLMFCSERFDVRIRYSTFVASAQRLLETVAQLSVLVSKDSCEHETHGMWEDPGCIEVNAEEKIQNARRQQIGHVDICRDWSQRDIQIYSEER